MQQVKIIASFLIYFWDLQNFHKYGSTLFKIRWYSAIGCMENKPTNHNPSHAKEHNNTKNVHQNGGKNTVPCSKQGWLGEEEIPEKK